MAFALLIALTLWVKISYNRWKRTHEFFGLVLLIVGVHIFVVNADVARYPLLAVWLYGLLGLALISFVYIRFLYRRWGPRFDYYVWGIERIGDIPRGDLRPPGSKDGLSSGAVRLPGDT